MVTRLDRLARSTRDLLNTVAAIAAKKAGFKSLAGTWADSATAHGRLMLAVLGGLAEFESSLIHTRTGEGRERAKARGVKMGPKFKLTPTSSARRSSAAIMARKRLRRLAGLQRVRLDDFEAHGVTKIGLPKDLEGLREAARRAINPIKPAHASTEADAKFLFTAKRTDAGRSPPPYYLVYFLLVELLGFKDLGKFEKLAWSIPIDLDGVAYLIEHRKLV